MNNTLSKFSYVLLMVSGVAGVAAFADGYPPKTGEQRDNAVADAVGSAASDKALSAAPGTRVAEPKVRPDFSGSWSLDTRASDDPQEKIKEAMKAMKPAGGGGRGMQGGSGGQGRGGGMGGGRQARGSSGGMDERGGMRSGDLSVLTAAPGTLNVSHEDPMLLFVDENDQRQRIFTDFRGASVSGSGSMQQRVTVAGWEGAVLVVETTMNSGARLIQRYQIEPETGQLRIASAIHLPGMQPVTFQLVYDRSRRGLDVVERPTRAGDGS